MFKKKVIKEIEKNKEEPSEVEKALKLLEEEEKRKIELFMTDYKIICQKHGLELTANPQIIWNVSKLK